MGHKSNIEWTDSTWNSIRGCSPVSPGCKNCYAANIAGRFSGPGQAFEGLVRINAAGERTNEWNGQITWVEKHLLDPLRWRGVKEQAGPIEGVTFERPRRIFVNSVSDVAHPAVTDGDRDRMFAVMALAPQHIFQILTKRPAELASYLYGGALARIREAVIGFTAQRINLQRTGEPVLEWSGIPMPNVLLGCSVENQEWADKRWEPMYALSRAGWATMVSYEPALGPVDWKEWEFLKWLISGGETQVDARPSHPDWHRAARDFCSAHGIAYFFKQWGDWAPEGDANPETRCPRIELQGQTYARVGKEAAGSLLDGRPHKAFPEGF